jgi:hypothetical protein
LVCSDGPAQPFWQAQSEPLEERGLSAIGTHDASQSEFALRQRRRRQDDVGALHCSEFLQDRARTVAEAGAALPTVRASSTA